MAEQAPPGFGSKIMHATFGLDGQRFYGGDAPPGQYEKPQGFTVALGIKDPAEADRVFAALAENGVVQMPIQETFWALRFGAVVDQFGTPWMVNCEKPASA
jgi:PhnB protein